MDQDEMKVSLILNIVDPGVGGVLIRGEKGTAKSTAVRSLANVLPDVEYVRGCRFRCDPSHPELLCSECMSELEAGKRHETEKGPIRVVELPLSATEDRIAGTLDLEHVLQTGKKRFEPGVLAQANRNILYVDEVNLLEDHIVDLLLDSAAMGVNYVEREGVSFSHPSKFILIGSMNPEEGELRPQLLDRFGLCVDVVGDKYVTSRAEVVMRRLEYDSDPDAFIEKFRPETEALREKISLARKRLKDVEVSQKMVEAASNIAIYFKMEGHRADITLVRAARANAAFEGKDSIDRDDFRTVAPMVLTHRVKKKPFEKSGLDRGELEECIKMY
ncbi:MAG: ATP-binding protein [Candidatus Methanomethylophilaceae archaeon]|nr:AAA family ATPase [Candidatus Methanomethylophilaceae archaeon]MDD3986759.1 AAA family ATPase [Candidatus Methanomethylophilaceae archaeon]